MDTSRPMDPAAAQHALQEIADARRAVRDVPWPGWLYPVNAALLGLMVLTPLLGADRTSWLGAGAVLVIGVNLLAGMRMGTPLALPSDRRFLAGVVVSAACLVASMLSAELTDRTEVFVALAATAVLAYGLGSLAHRSSTRR